MRPATLSICRRRQRPVTTGNRDRQEGARTSTTPNRRRSARLQRDPRRSPLATPRNTCKCEVGGVPRSRGRGRRQTQTVGSRAVTLGCQLRGSLTRTRAPGRRWAILSRGSGRRIALRRTALDNPFMTSCLQMRWFSSDNGASRYLFDPSLPGQAPGAAAHARRRGAHTLSLGQRGEASRATRTGVAQRERPPRRTAAPDAYVEVPTLMVIKKFAPAERDPASRQL